MVSVERTRLCATKGKLLSPVNNARGSLTGPAPSHDLSRYATGTGTGTGGTPGTMVLSNLPVDRRVLLSKRGNSGREPDVHIYPDGAVAVAPGRSVQTCKAQFVP